ncbi:MAG: hypothetical protein NZ895_00010 [Archaeoglobaceae archaeon]|nr:hypothetical protein [Archaeoglobaceae archaeon]MDW8014033.1 hypothetical protein [Archaeoglobaceae archaeon]
MRYIPLLLILLISTSAALENLTEKHVNVEWKVSEEKDCYYENERIFVYYEIKPRALEYRTLLGGDEIESRIYFFKTELANAFWKIGICYYKAPGCPSFEEEARGARAYIEVKMFKIDDERKGVQKIYANLTAFTPRCADRLCDFKAIEVSCNDCDARAFKTLTLKVVNETAFRKDLDSMKLKVNELIEKLKAENIYEEEYFLNVSKLINDTESLMKNKDFINADKILKKIDESLRNLTTLFDRKLAEKLYSEVSSKVEEARKLIINVSTSLEKLKTHEKYSEFYYKYKNFEDLFNSTKSKLGEVKSLIDRERFSRAVEELRRLSVDSEKLKKDLKEFEESLKNLTSKDLFSDLFSNFSSAVLSTLSTPFIYPILAFAILITLFLKRKRRRKWDELR